MWAKEEFHKTFVKLRGSAYRISQTGLSAPSVQLMMELGIHSTLAAVLAGGTVLTGNAPFGLAMVAASGTGLYGAASLIGAGFGYLTLLPFSDALRYFSAAILTFSIAFAFYDVRPIRHPWAMPLLAAGMNGCTGLIYLGEKGWRAQDVIFFLIELALTVGCTYCFRQVLLPRRTGREDFELNDRWRLSLLVLVCGVLISLSGVHLWKEVSLGRCAAVICALAAAWKGGSCVGGVVALSVGLAMDLAGGNTPLYAMTWGVAALSVGLCRSRGKVCSTAAFVLVSSACVLLTWEDGMRISLLCEGMLGSTTFMALPERLWERTSPLLRLHTPITATQTGREYVQRRLSSTAGAFRTLYESMRGSFRPQPNDNDTAAIFDRAAAKVCRSCVLRMSCWEREYVSTFNALNDATAAILARGRGLPEDFPRHFSTRCHHFPAFLEAVNQEVTALLYRRQYNTRLRESRMAVCQQYGQMSALLERAAAELGRELVPDLPGQRRLSQYLSAQGLSPQTEVFRDEYGRLRAYIRGEGWQDAASTDHIARMEQALGIPMRAEAGEDTLTLVQLEPLMAVAGIAALKKDGETVCGDAGTYFKREDGVLYVLLCDGMGSGPLANRESNLAVRLLEQFLCAGVDTQHALITLNSALALRSEEEGGFTTVDLLQVDLFTGEGSIYKLGAAPTYLRHGDSVRKITGSSLPAGLSAPQTTRPDHIRLHLEPGDCVLMISDGVTGTGEDDWVRRRLRDFHSDSPKELARNLITDCPEGVTDDRTALVIKIEKRTVDKR